MKAISIRQPWAWAICHAGKRVENRDWRHAPSYRGPLLIHAAKGCTIAEFDDTAESILCARGILAKPELPELHDLPRGAIVARVRLVAVARNGIGGHRWSCPCSDGGACTLCGEPLPTTRRCPKPDPWAVPGCLGLILADVVPLATPVPFKGALGFFEVPDELVAVPS